jgi:bile acid:Na+ symporter, BASS family
MEDQSVATAVVLPAALAVIMFSLGLSLVADDFKRVVRFPRGVAIGLANLIVLSPLLAFLIAEGFGLPAALAAGLVLLGASPGGTMANMLTHLARGDVALSVTMTALSSLAAVIVVPLYLNLAVDFFNADVGTDIEMPAIVLRVFLITLVPLAAGMLVRDRSPAWTARNYDRVRKAAMVVFVAVVILAVAVEYEKVVDNFAEVAAAAIALNLAAMTLSFSIAKGARLEDRQATAIAMELGIHNATLAIAVGATVATELAVPAAVYSSFMFVSAGLFARMMYRRNADDPAAAGRPEGLTEARN